MDIEDIVEQTDQSGFVIPSYGAPVETVIFLRSFWRPGMVEFHDGSVELSGNRKDEFVEVLRRLDGTLTMYKKNGHRGFIESDSGCVEFRAWRSVDKKGEDTTRLSISGILMPPAIPEFVNLLRDFEKRYRSSKYWINIRECYWSNKRDEVNEIVKGYPETAFAGTLSGLYTGIDVDKMLKVFYSSNENILLTLGEPGTGKTQLIKKAIYDLTLLRKKNLDITYTKDVDALRNNSFWAELHANGSDMLILDDLDNELKPRTDKDSSEHNVVSRLLSFSNGVFPVQTKILITSNVSDQEIDPALIRPGRCLDVLELRPMPLEKAKRLWGEMTPGDVRFEEIFGDRAEVTQAHFMSEVARTQSDLSRAYITDADISVRDMLTHGDRRSSMKFGAR